MVVGGLEVDRRNGNVVDEEGRWSAADLFASFKVGSDTVVAQEC
jgi:hypothetical protein